MKLIFFKDSEKVTITYQMQFQYAKTAEEIVFETNACISFLTKLCDPSKPSKYTGPSEEIDSMNDLIKMLKRAAKFFSHLTDVQKALKLSFPMENVVPISLEDRQEIEELYLLLCEKKALRVNAKINSTDTLDVETSYMKADPIVGKNILLVFAQESTYDLLGQSFSIFTANTLINAVVKDIKKDSEKTTIYYGDTDSQTYAYCILGIFDRR